MLRNSLGITVMAMSISGCQALSQVASALSGSAIGYAGVTSDMAQHCLIGVDETSFKAEGSGIGLFGPKIAGNTRQTAQNSGGTAQTPEAAQNSGGTAQTPEAAQNSGGTAQTPEAAQNSGGGARTVIPTTVDVDDIHSVWNRSHACLRTYARVSGILKVYDSGGSVVSGAAGIGGLASAGSAEPTTNAYLAGLALAPVVLRDAANFDPQQANAFQALRAVSLVQCQIEGLRTGRHRLNSRIDASEGGSGSEAFDDLLDKARNAHVQLIESIRLIEAGSVPDPVLPTDRGVTREHQLRALKEAEAAMSATLSRAEELQRAVGNVDWIADDEYLAGRLNEQLEIINLIWGRHASELLPTPEQTLRNILASPLTLSARLVSGESGKEVISPEVGAVRFNYAAARQPYGLKPIQIPETTVWSIPEMSLPAISVAREAGLKLEERTASLAAAINEISGVMTQCEAAAA